MLRSCTRQLHTEGVAKQNKMLLFSWMQVSLVDKYNCDTRRPAGLTHKHEQCPVPIL